MKVNVNYLAQLKQAAGISSESVELNTPCSVQDLVTRLAENHGEPLRSFLLDTEGSLRTSILIVVGDTQVHWETPVQLKEGDVVSFLSPLAGG
jgi:molybdopterin converting factor small subunit